MYKTIRHARKAWPDTLLDPCLLSGKDSEKKVFFKKRILKKRSQIIII
jgi:hypothetical protein